MLGRAAAALVLGIGTACGARVDPAQDVIARVGDEPLQQSVVESLAERDGLSEAEARARALDTLRLVAASRAEREARPGEPTAELEPRRRDQILRAARARLWLEEGFEASHRPADIPKDDPELVKLRSSGRYVHDGPTVEVCQLIVGPPPLADGQRSNPLAADPAWREQAARIMADVERRARRYVPVGDPGACPLMKSLMRFENKDRGSHRIQFETGGFELGGCAEEAADGSCKTPFLDPTWEQAVAAAQAPAFIPPFHTPFGLHLVYLHATHEPRPADDPATEESIRQSAHPEWQRKEFEAYMERLRSERTPRVVSTVEDG